jgi:CBS domain-containing protein
MKIRDVMTAEIRSADLDTTIEELATIMRDEDIGSVPILDNGELCGIATDRDIVVRCIAAGRDPSETTVGDILSTDLQVVAPNQDTEEAARIMADLQVRRLPVVEKGRLVGMVSIGDLAVKSDTDEVRIGRTLEEVSEGVRAVGADAQRAKRTGIGANTRGSNRQGGSTGATAKHSHSRSGRSEQGSGRDRNVQRSAGSNAGQLRQNSNARQNSTAAGRKPQRQQPGSTTQMTERNAKQVRGRKPAAITGGGRQETIEAESGRYARSTRGRIEAEQGSPRRQQRSSGRDQGIANRSASEETKRQSRVVKMDNAKGSRSQRRKAS